MSRLFCTFMLLVTLAAAWALWPGEAVESAHLIVLQPQSARAQSPTSWDPAAAGWMGGLRGLTNTEQLPPLVGPTAPLASQQPAGWLNSPPAPEPPAEPFAAAPLAPAPIASPSPVRQAQYVAPPASGQVPPATGQLASPGPASPTPPPTALPPSYPAAPPAGPPLMPSPSAAQPPGTQPPVPQMARSVSLNNPLSPPAIPTGFAATLGDTQRTDYPFRPRIFEIDGASIIARINGEVVLAGEILGSVNEILAKNAAQIPAEQLDQYRQKLMKQRLKQLIDSRLVNFEARRKIPEEKLPEIERQVGKEYDKHILPMMMKQMQVETRQQLEAQLTQFGTSLARERKAFVDQTIARQWVQMHVKENQSISRQELLDYYQSHLREYEHPGRARWEELAVRFDRHPTKAAAWAKLAALGNQALAGQPWADLARAQSEGGTADAGGYHDWTQQGSLKHEAIDAQLFQLPIGQLSPIIETDRGLHIVRVVEREDAGRDAFTDVQQAIKKQILALCKQQATEQYLEDLRKKAVVWTMFDGFLTAEQMDQADAQPANIIR